MPQPALRREVAEDAVERVNEALRQGFRPQGHSGSGPGAIAHAADAGNIPLGTLQSRLRSAKATYGLVPDETLYQLPRYQQPVPRLQLLPAAPPRPAAVSGDARRVLIIPDRHNDPRHPHRLDVTTWIARFGSEHRFDDVVDLGDSGTWDSVSRHDKNDTYKAKTKPGIRDDLDNMVAQERAWQAGRAPDWKPRQHKCRGNHEQRLFDFENQHPEAYGTHTHEYSQILLQSGWRERAFGEILYLNDCGFTHAPLNGMGKSMGGKTVGQRAGDMLCHTLFHGHTHKRYLYDAAKMGRTDCITIASPGCALPWGEIEHYCTHSPTGWWWGVGVATLVDGLCPDIEFVSMLKLRDRYSDDGADIAA